MESTCETESCCQSSDCSQESCCSAQSCHPDKFSMMMWLVKSAKTELIREKVKARLETLEGKKLDNLADFLVESMLEHKKAKAEFYKLREEQESRDESAREKFWEILRGEE